jgi:glycerol kinase
VSAVVAIDAGTTGVRSRVFFDDSTPSFASYREFTQYFPRPGWVEHDPIEIWDAVVATLAEVCSHIVAIGQSIAAIGITNQRETIVAWDRQSGRPFGRAIVWQDRRTADRCASLSAALPLVREQSGLVLDPYFSGSKIEWMMREGGVTRSPDLAFGTIDSWIVWNLTGGTSFVTDPSNASRTMLFDIRRMTWSDDLCALFDVPRETLPHVVPSSGRCGTTIGQRGIPAHIPIAGVAGDQQAALFGQACFQPGATKNTYGTGSFVLMNVGHACPEPRHGMLTTVAWDLGSGPPTYALEGAIFITGAAIQWLRDGLQIIDHAAAVGPLAESVTDSGGVIVVPAFTGLGSPWWDPHARGAVFGITRGTTKAHIARAVVESMAFQTRDVVEAMAKASGVSITELRVDGGAAVMDLLLQTQANLLNVDVLRPRELESTALGAAFLAGLAEGVWESLDSVASSWQLERRFSPIPNGNEDAHYAQWKVGVERSLNWSHT